MGPEQGNSMWKSWVIALVVLCAAGIGYAVYKSSFFSTKPTAAQLLQSIPEATMAGDYERVLREYEAIQQATDDKNALALATWRTGVAKFELSQETEDLLQHIRELKEIVLNPEVNARTRGLVLSSLASLYCGSGRTPEVFGILYDGPVFGQYKAENDPNLSSRHLHEWADTLYPNPRNTVRIARWYVEETVWDKSISDEKRAEYKGIAEEYLQRAEGEAQKEIERAQTRNELDEYLAGEPYTAYQFWRMMEIAGLGLAFGEPYKSEYRKEFENFFIFAENHKNDATLKYQQYAHMFYAYFLLNIDGEADAAREQLLIAMERANQEPRPGSNPFHLFMRHESSKPAWDFTSQVMYDMMQLSPEFKAFVESLRDA